MICIESECPSSRGFPDSNWKFRHIPPTYIRDAFRMCTMNWTTCLDWVPNSSFFIFVHISASDVEHIDKIGRQSEVQNKESFANCQFWNIKCHLGIEKSLSQVHFCDFGSLFKSLKKIIPNQCHRFIF